MRTFIRMTRARNFKKEEWRNHWGSSETIGRSSSPQPGVVAWARVNHQEKPYFIKVIPKSSSNEIAKPSMNVPAAFVKEHYRELQRDVTLENKDGRTWSVSFQTNVASPKLLKGWEMFACENGLETGDHMVFILERDSLFRFTHFDKEGNIRRHVITPPINNPVAAAADSDQFQTSSLGTRRKQSTDNYPDRHTLRKEPASLEIDNKESPDEHSEGGDVSHYSQEAIQDFDLEFSKFFTESPNVTTRCCVHVRVAHEEDTPQAPNQVEKMLHAGTSVTKEDLAISNRELRAALGAKIKEAMELMRKEVVSESKEYADTQALTLQKIIEENFKITQDIKSRAIHESTSKK